MGGLRHLIAILLCPALCVPAQQATAPAKRPAFWAFRTPTKPEVPKIDGAANPVDAFLATKLRSKDLDFSPRADHATLIRRVTFDLTGLPPTSSDYEESYEQTVERLLASPRYGERWGRHWLDVVRFGETDGGEHNYERLYAWPYRDYVIDAFNQDKPYDQFIREQLTGDLLEPANPKMVAATGFLTAGPWDSVSAELNKDKAMKAMARMDELDDMVTTTFHTFQALTVNCARCHDHKFDPIPTRDYYKLTSVFQGVGFGTRTVATAEQTAAAEQQAKPYRDQLKGIDEKIGQIENPARTKLLLAKYRKFDRAQPAGSRKITINPIWNRESFAAANDAHFRLVIHSAQKGSPKIDLMEMLPDGPVVKDWRSARAASDDSPVILDIPNPKQAAVTSVEWSTDRVSGQRDGALNVYRIEASADGTSWRTICSSLDHVGKNEQDLPEVTEAELQNALTPDQRPALERLRTERAETQRRLKEIPELPRIYAARPYEIAPSFVLERGSATRQKDPVLPGSLTALTHRPAEFGLSAESPDAERRRALAAWITDPGNPLTARVVVNRVWYLHFGKGIVNTPSDFGVMGDRPSHPELLDWLAVSFMENGWSLKWLHRLIVTSKAYQQSAAMNEKAFAVDADNRLLWHMPLKRMDAETLRDSILAVAGNLDLRAGGPGFLLQKKGDRGSYIYKTLDNDGPEVWRRAVYRFVVRAGERIMLDSFDCPDPSVATPQRSASNTPVQALTLLNNDFVVRQAGFFAERLQRDAGQDPERQIARAYSLLYGRSPNEREVTVGRQFIQSQSLTLYCRTLLNTNEFIYVP